MRTSLVPSVLTSVAGNLAYRNSDPRVFELRPVFQVVEGQELPYEPLRLTVALCGRRAPEGWAQERAGVDFYDIKGLAEGILGLFTLPALSWETDSREPFLHPGKSCALRCGNQLLGTLGEVHPQILREFDIDETVYLLDLDLTALFQKTQGHPGFRPLSRYPDVCRDSALLVDEEIPAARVLSILGEIKNKSIEEITLFDVYRGPGVPAGKKSLAIRVRYRSLEKTLTDEEIQGIHGKLIRTLEKNLGAEIR